MGAPPPGKLTGSCGKSSFSPPRSALFGEIGLMEDGACAGAGSRRGERARRRLRRGVEHRRRRSARSPRWSPAKSQLSAADVCEAERRGPLRSSSCRARRARCTSARPGSRRPDAWSVCLAPFGSAVVPDAVEDPADGIGPRARQRAGRRKARPARLGAAPPSSDEHFERVPSARAAISWAIAAWSKSRKTARHHEEPGARSALTSGIPPRGGGSMGRIGFWIARRAGPGRRPGASCASRRSSASATTQACLPASTPSACEARRTALDTQSRYSAEAHELGSGLVDREQLAGCRGGRVCSIEIGQRLESRRSPGASRMARSRSTNFMHLSAEAVVGSSSTKLDPAGRPCSWPCGLARPGDDAHPVSTLPRGAGPRTPCRSRPGARPARR